MGRFTAKNKDNDADLIWRELLEGAQAAAACLSNRNVHLRVEDLIKTTDPARPQPTDMMVLFAVKQILIATTFREGGPERKLSVGEFNRQFKAALKQRATNPATGRKFRYLSGYHLDALTTYWTTDEDARLAVEAFANHHNDIRAALTDVVTKWRGSDAQVLTSTDIFEGHRGANAIASIRRRIVAGASTEEPPTDPTEVEPELDEQGWLKNPEGVSNQPFTFVIAKKGDPRIGCLKEIRDCLFGQGDAPIVNCFAPGMRGAQTALATSLFDIDERNVRGCSLPMCYFPIHGRMKDDPKDSFSELVHSIFVFYRKATRQSDPSDARAPQGINDTIAMISRIRLMMAERPSVLIFDGFRAGAQAYGQGGTSLHNLRSAIAGDRLLDLIERLTMIPTPGTDDPIDVERFRRNRFVIMSDNRLYGAYPDAGRYPPEHPHLALRLLKGRSFEIPPPQKSMLQEVLPWYGYQAPGQITWLREKVGQNALPDETTLASEFKAHTDALGKVLASRMFDDATITEALAGVVSAYLKISGQTALPSIGKPRGTETALNKVLGKLLGLLSSGGVDPAWRVFLHLIAIAPGGLRPKTLARIYEHFCEATGSTDPALKRTEINAKIAAMLEACHGIVSIGKSDHLEALRDKDLPLVFRDRFSFGPWEIKIDRAIDFNFDDVKAVFIEDAESEAGGSYAAGLHFLLAEEAHEQAVHLARYDPFQSEESIHRQSRLLTAIYHGAASLGSSELSLQLPFAGAGRFLPDNPVDRWIRLYSFAYRRNLERFPNYNMVRTYDAAETKLDLLLALAQPRLCWGTEALAKLSLPALVTTESNVTPEKQRKNILRQFALELRRSAVALSRDLEIEWSLGGLEGKRFDEVLIKLGEDIHQLTLDEGERPDTINTLSERTLKEIEATFNNHQTTKYLDLVHRQVLGLMNNANRNQLIGPKWQAAIFAKARITPSKLHKLMDYLNLYAEILLVSADRDFALRKSSDAEVTDDIVDGYVRSFSAFYIAEYFSQRHFLAAPDSVAQPIRGHAARGLIRAALKLERFRASRLKATQPQPPGGWFWTYAHAISDDVARSLAHYPRERVGILTQEATLARYYVSRNSESYRKFLTMAMQSLVTAEPLLMKLGMHGHLRQRFLLERSKVIGEFARLEIAAGKWSNAKRYLEICASDVEEFGLLSTDRSVHWPALADRYNRKIVGLREELARARIAAASPPVSSN